MKFSLFFLSFFSVFAIQPSFASDLNDKAEYAAYNNPSANTTVVERLDGRIKLFHCGGTFAPVDNAIPGALRTFIASTCVPFTSGGDETGSVYQLDTTYIEDSEQAVVTASQVLQNSGKVESILSTFLINTSSAGKNDEILVTVARVSNAANETPRLQSARATLSLVAVSPPSK